MKKFSLTLLILLALLFSAIAQSDEIHHFMDIAPGADKTAVVATLAEKDIQLDVDAIYQSALVTRPGQVTLYGMPAQLRVSFDPSMILSLAQYQVSLEDFQAMAASSNGMELLADATAYAQLLIGKLTEKYGAPTGGIMYSGAGDSAVWDYPGDARTGKLDAAIMQRLMEEEMLVDITLCFDNLSLRLMWESFDGVAASPDCLEVSILYDYQWDEESLWYVAGFAQGYGPYSDKGMAAYWADVAEWEEREWGEAGEVDSFSQAEKGDNEDAVLTLGSPEWVQAIEAEVQARASLITVLVDGVYYGLETDGSSATLASVQSPEGMVGAYHTVPRLLDGYKVEHIGSFAYWGRDGMYVVEIPNGIKSIGEQAFYGSSIKTITIAPSVTDIGKMAFESCIYLENVNLSPGLLRIGPQAFMNCLYGLKSIVLPEGVISIGDAAFANCGILESITIPASVTEIAENAFSGCNQLTMMVTKGSYAEQYAQRLRIAYVNPIDIGDAVVLVKSNKLADYPFETVGVAFDAFFGNPTWEPFQGTDGHIYVQVEGKAQSEGASVDVRLQFLVQNDGQFQISYFEVGGMPQSSKSLTAFLDVVYDW